MYAIAIHGGAGAVPRATLAPERERSYRAGLESALDGGFAVLERGGTSLDAVATAVRKYWLGTRTKCSSSANSSAPAPTSST